MLFLYDLPNWLLGIVVITPIVLCGYAIYFGCHRFIRPEFTESDRNVALTVLQVIATVNSLLLAFSAVSVWDSFSAADAAVVKEANTISALALDLTVFDSPASRDVHRMLFDYANQVVKVEWVDMQDGEASADVWDKFDRVFQAIGRLEPDTPRRVALLPEILGRTNELLKERQSRLYTSEAEVPGTLWTVVLLGTILTMLVTVVLPPTRFNIGMVGVLSLSIGFVFFFIVAMDRPFAGKESISAKPFERAISHMQRWDVLTAPKPN